MSEDMSDIIQKMSEMLKNNEIPDNVKSIINNLSNQPDSGISSNENEQENKSNESKEDDSSQAMPNIDLNTMLKMKSIIDSMNKQQNDPRANLLRSLKPYLKPSRKDKVEQYIKIFSMGKVFETLNPLGGEKKNDV